MIHTVNLFIFLVLFIFVINKILSYVSHIGLQLFIFFTFSQFTQVDFSCCKIPKDIEFSIIDQEKQTKMSPLRSWNLNPLAKLLRLHRQSTH